jgi:hypothetical protein
MPLAELVLKVEGFECKYDEKNPYNGCKIN